MVTYIEIVATSSPPWFDCITVTSLWLAGLVNAYLGLFRVNHSIGINVSARVIVAIGMFLLAGRFTWWLYTHDDLPISWWVSVSLLFISVGSVILGVDRARYKAECVE